MTCPARGSDSFHLSSSTGPHHTEWSSSCSRRRLVAFWTEAWSADRLHEWYGLLWRLPRLGYCTGMRRWAIQGRTFVKLDDCPTEVRDNDYRDCPCLHFGIHYFARMALSARKRRASTIFLDGLGDQWDPICSSATCAETIP